MTFLILFLFLLDASESSEGLDLTGTFGSSIFPKTLGPVNFLASAFIVSEGSILFLLTGSAVFISVFSSFTSTGSSTVSATVSAFGFGVKSILPSTEGPERASALATIFSISFFDILLIISYTSPHQFLCWD